jgi:hypothetical protein
MSGCMLGLARSRITVDATPTSRNAQLSCGAHTAGSARHPLEVVKVDLAEHLCF